MRLCLLIGALVFGALAPARAGEPPPGPPAPPPFSEEAGFLGACGAEVSDGDTRSEPRARAFEGLGMTWVATEPVRWDAVEPLAPAPTPRYDWRSVDRTLASWQRLGCAPVLVVSPACGWASPREEQTDWARLVRSRLPAADAAVAIRGVTFARPVAAPPQDGYWKHWQRFLEDLLERYDGDGILDMPGLVRPLQALEILDQVGRPTRWLGSADEYLRLLHHAREAAARAQSRCALVHAAVDLRGLFAAGDQPPEAWKERFEAQVPATPALLRIEAERGLDLLLRSLESARLFDVLPQVGSGNLAEDQRNVAALRERLDGVGATNVAVWLIQGPTARLGAPRVELLGGRPSPAEEALRARLRREAARQAEEERDAEGRRAGGDATPAPERPALAWLRRGTAYDLVRGAALARAAGAARVLTFGVEAGPPRVEGEEPPIPGDQGLLRASVVPSQGHAPSIRYERTSSWCALRQMNALLLGHLGAREGPLGAPGTAVRFTFGPTAPLPWVKVLLPFAGGSWAGEPGQPLPTQRTLVPAEGAEVVVEEIALDEAAPRRRRLPVVDGLVALELTPAPVYVFPVVGR